MSSGDQPNSPASVSVHPKIVHLWYQRAPKAELRRCVLLPDFDPGRELNVSKPPLPAEEFAGPNSPAVASGTHGRENVLCGPQLSHPGHRPPRQVRSAWHRGPFADVPVCE